MIKPVLHAYYDIAVYAVSSDVIITTSVLTGIVVAVALLIVITLGTIKLLKRRKTFVQKTQRCFKIIIVIQKFTIIIIVQFHVHCRHNQIEDSIALDAKEDVVMRGSLEAKPPPALTISSANLRVLDPIGQGRQCIV